MSRKVSVILAIALIAVVLIISQEGRNEKHSAEKIFPPLPDHVLASMSAELGEHLNSELPLLKVSKVIIMTQTNKSTGWVHITAQVYRFHEGLEVPLVIIGGKEMSTAQEAFQDLKRKVVKHLKNNSFI